jgi:hypothetical protein
MSGSLNHAGLGAERTRTAVCALSSTYLYEHRTGPAEEVGGDRIATRGIRGSGRPDRVGGASVTRRRRLLGAYCPESLIPPRVHVRGVETMLASAPRPRWP